MTAGELIRLLSSHNPDTPVRLAIEDEETGQDTYGEPTCVHRMVRADGVFIEVFA